MQCYKVNMDNYQFYLLARVRIFKSSRQDSSLFLFILQVHLSVPKMETLMVAPLVMVTQMLPPFPSTPASSMMGLRHSRSIFHRFFRFLPFILGELIPLALGCSTSPPRARLLWLFISGITIKITTYLFSRELEVDLSRSDVDDHVGGVEERSSKNDGRAIFFTHV